MENEKIKEILNGKTFLEAIEYLNKLPEKDKTSGLCIVRDALEDLFEDEGNMVIENIDYIPEKDDVSKDKGLLMDRIRCEIFYRLQTDYEVFKRVFFNNLFTDNEYLFYIEKYCLLSVEKEGDASVENVLFKESCKKEHWEKRLNNYDLLDENKNIIDDEKKKDRFIKGLLSDLIGKHTEMVVKDLKKELLGETFTIHELDEYLTHSYCDVDAADFLDHDIDYTNGSYLYANVDPFEELIKNIDHFSMDNEMFVEWKMLERKDPIFDSVIEVADIERL